MSLCNKPLTFIKEKLCYLPSPPPLFFIFTASKPRREVKITLIHDFFNYILLKVIPSLAISSVESFRNAGCWQQSVSKANPTPQERDEAVCVQQKYVPATWQLFRSHSEFYLPMEL